MPELTPAQRSGDEPITDVALLAALPVGATVRTGPNFVRTKTHTADEWDYVLNGAEVLNEGRGSVTVFVVSAPGGDQTITSAEVLAALPEGAAVSTRAGDIRRKTHAADEWDFVLTSDEVLVEGGGRVTLIVVGSDG